MENENQPQQTEAQINKPSSLMEQRLAEMANEAKRESQRPTVSGAVKQAQNNSTVKY